MAAATPSRTSADGDAVEWPLTASGYTLGGVVGQGAFAKVYRAECPSNGATVAVKVIELDKVQTPIETIMNEVRTMALCRHPNVLPLHAAFVNGADLWLVSPLMTKGSAFWVVRVMERGGDADPEQPKMPEAAIKVVLRQTLRGLEYLHSQKQIHRDIKAGNILIADDGAVMIGDFGVAGWMADEVSRRDGRRDTFVGTPCWMAPEVMEQSKGYNERADIWSLGITALELATGKAPYASLQPMQVLIETLNKPPPSLETYRRAGAPVPKLSRDFNNFVAKCLVRDPSKRPSATELLSDRFLRGAKDEDLLAVIAPLGEVGPDTAAALGEKPGYAAAELPHAAAASEFAEGTTWVFWDGTGSMAGASAAKVEDSAATTESFAEALSGIGRGLSGADAAHTHADAGRSLAAERRDGAEAAAAGSGAGGDAHAATSGSASASAEA